MVLVHNTTRVRSVLGAFADLRSDCAPVARSGADGHTGVQEPSIIIVTFFLHCIFVLFLHPSKEETKVGSEGDGRATGFGVIGGGQG